MSVSDMSEDAISLAIAEAWTQAVRDADRPRIENLLSQDFVVWRNVTRDTQEREAFIDLAIALSTILPGFHYRNPHRIVFPGGFVQQHIVTGNGPSGQPFEAPACIICHVENGRIAKMDEYYDSAHDPR